MPRARTGTLIYKRTTGWNARVWTVVRDEDGTERDERRWVPLETHDKELAKRKLAKIVGMLERGELVADAAPAEAKRVETVAQHAATWIADRKAARIVMASDEEHILETHVLPTIGSMALDAVRPAFIRSILVAVARIRSHETVKKTRGVMLRLFDAAWKAEIIKENPVERADMPEHTRIDERQRKILSDEQVLAFLNGRAAGPEGKEPRKDAETRLLELKVMAVCSRVLGGMRTSELNRWDWSMWDRAGFAEVKIQRAKAKRGRTGKVQTLIVPEPMRPILNAWHVAHGSPDAGPVFPVTKGERKGEHRKERGVSYAARLRRALWRMGIRDHDVHHDTPTSRKADWHSFRRAFATALAEAGTNEQTARLLVAHGDASVHARYVQQTRAMQHIPSAAVPQFGAFALPGKDTALTKGQNRQSRSPEKPGTPERIRTSDLRLRRPGEGEEMRGVAHACASSAARCAVTESRCCVVSSGEKSLAGDSWKRGAIAYPGGVVWS